MEAEWPGRAERENETMMSDPTTIDYVAANEAKHRLVLIIQEDRPWDDYPTMHDQLRMKVDTYIGYVMDPSFQREYPGVMPEDVDMMLFCFHPPGPKSLIFFDTVRQVLAQYKMTFSHAVNPMNRPAYG